jgi:acyl carrier protein
MIPGMFKRLETMPLTNNGKTDKNALRSLNRAQLDADVPYSAPRNDIEELLSEIWQDVLQMKKVGIFDNFITLGGHSLAAIRISTRINEELRLDLPLNKIFELPTIAEYSSFIEQTLLQLMDEEDNL